MHLSGQFRHPDRIAFEVDRVFMDVSNYVHWNAQEFRDNLPLVLQLWSHDISYDSFEQLSTIYDAIRFFVSPYDISQANFIRDYMWKSLIATLAKTEPADLNRTAIHILCHVNTLMTLFSGVPELILCHSKTSEVGYVYIRAVSLLLYDSDRNPVFDRNDQQLGYTQEWWLWQRFGLRREPVLREGNSLYKPDNCPIAALHNIGTMPSYERYLLDRIVGDMARDCDLFNYRLELLSKIMSTKQNPENWLDLKLSLS